MKPKHDFKIKQYTYINIYSILNILICALHLASLSHKYQQPFGLFCSSIRAIENVQYFHLVAGEFLTHFFISMSNFAYMAFALNRLSLVGQNDDKHLSCCSIRHVTETSTLRYMTCAFVFSAGLSVIKPFRYEINRYFYMSHRLTSPMLFVYDYDLRENSTVGFLLRFVFDLVYDVLNYVVFAVVNLGIDLALLARIRKACAEKETRLADQSDVCRLRVRQANQKSIRDVIKLIVASTLVNFVLKTIGCVLSLNDFRIFVSNFGMLRTMRFSAVKDWSSFPYSMRYFCHLAKSCEVVRSLGDFLFLVSLSTNFLFMRKFDRNFKAAFEAKFKSKPDNIY